MALYGRQEPTYWHAPQSFTVAAADETAELMRRAGQPMDPWQHFCLRLGMGEQPDGRWAAFEVADFVQRQNGKGGIVEARGISGLYLVGERLLYYTAHNLDTTRMAFERCVDLVTNMDDLRRRVAHIRDTNSQEAIELVNGAEWRFRTRGRVAQTRDTASAGKTGGKGRGFSCDCLFADEALYLQQDAMDALLPTMLARPNPQVWWLSTPPIDPSAAIVQIRRDGYARRDRLAYAEWANPEGADLTDQEVLARVNPAYGIRLNAGVLEVLRGRLGPAGFARECGGIWPPEPDARWLVIPEVAWLNAFDPSARIVGPLALGVAVRHPDRSTASIVACGRDRYGRRVVERTGRQMMNTDGAVVDVPDYRPGTRWVIPRLRELVASHSPLVVVIDDRQIADEAEEAGLPVYRANVGDVVSACGMFYSAVADPDPLKHDLVQLGQDDMTTAVAGAAKRIVGNLWAWERRDPTVDVTTLVAGSLALWALATPRIHIRRLRPFAMFGG